MTVLLLFSACSSLVVQGGGAISMSDDVEMKGEGTAIVLMCLLSLRGGGKKIGLEGVVLYLALK